LKDQIRVLSPIVTITSPYSGHHESWLEVTIADMVLFTIVLALATFRQSIQVKKATAIFKIVAVFLRILAMFIC